MKKNHLLSVVAATLAITYLPTTARAEDAPADLNALRQAVEAKTKDLKEAQEKLKTATSTANATGENTGVNCEESAATGFNNFTAIAGSGAQLASTELAAAYTNWGTGTQPGSRMGFRLSTSMPIKVEDQKRYVDHELQLRDGGLANFSVSWGSTAGYGAKKNADGTWTQPKGCLQSGRFFKVDRHYFGRENLTNDSVGLFYLTNGIGIRGIKRQDQGDTAEKTSASGYLYLGIGMDGPLHLATGGEGYYDASLRYTYNRLNKDFLGRLYGNNGLENVQSVAVQLKLNFNNAVAASIEYSLPVGAAKGYGMREITLLSLTYAPAKKSAAESKSPADADKAKEFHVM